MNSNLVQNVRIGTLETRVDDIETEIATKVKVPIENDIDMNGHSLTDVGSVAFKGSNATQTTQYTTNGPGQTCPVRLRLACVQ